jgi:adenosylcobinamide kinase / adenosylcobinamide-phosphate guanylyltransferase
MLTVLLGGARSGKSAAALELAARSGNDVCFIATSPRIEGDAELDARIAAHRAERPAVWTTIETELDLAGALDEAGVAHVVVDCLTTWLGNLMHHGLDDDAIALASGDALTAVGRRTGSTTVVTNEVGQGIVPADDMTRRYRDLLGRLNQDWVAASERAYLMVAGRALPLSDLGSIPT